MVLVFSLVIAVLSLLYAGYNTFRVLKYSPGNEKMVEISNAIREGAMAYMHRQFKTVGIFAVILFFLIAFGMGFKMALTFLGGAAFSALAGYIGMSVSVRVNGRTAAAAEHGLREALSVAFRGGSVTGLSVVGLSLLGVSSSLWPPRGFASELPPARRLSTSCPIDTAFRSVKLAACEVNTVTSTRCVPA